MAITNEFELTQVSPLNPHVFSSKPPKHEWIELITLLSTSDDPHFREIGLAELKKCAARENMTHYVNN